MGDSHRLYFNTLQLSIEQLDKATDEIEDSFIKLLNKIRAEELCQNEICQYSIDIEDSPSGTQKA